jgi:hypothetical protein
MIAFCLPPAGVSKGLLRGLSHVMETTTSHSLVQKCFEHFYSRENTTTLFKVDDNEVFRTNITVVALLGNKIYQYSQEHTASQRFSCMAAYLASPAGPHHHLQCCTQVVNSWTYISGSGHAMAGTCQEGYGSMFNVRCGNLVKMCVVLGFPEPESSVAHESRILAESLVLASIIFSRHHSKLFDDT